MLDEAALRRRFGARVARLITAQEDVDSEFDVVPRMSPSIVNAKELGL